MEENKTPQTTALTLPAITVDGIAVAEQDGLQTKAVSLVDEAISNKADLRVMEGFATLGRQSQTAASRFLDKPLSEIAKQTASGKTTIDAQILDLRAQVDDINPTSFKKKPIIRFLCSFGLGNTLVNRFVRSIYANAESIQQNIDKVGDGLKKSRVLILEDNATLAAMNEGLMEEVVKLRKNQLLGKAIAEEVQKRLDSAVDEQEVKLYTKLLHAVLTRVQDLYAMEQMMLQYRISITTTYDGNIMLADTIDRYVDIVVNAAQVGLAIRAAQESQARVIGLADDSRRMLEQLMEDTAEATKSGAKRISELASTPIVSPEKLQKTCDTIMEAMGEIQTSYQKGIENARAVIPQLEQMRDKVRNALPDDSPANAALPKEQAIDAVEVLR